MSSFKINVKTLTGINYQIDDLTSDVKIIDLKYKFQDLSGAYPDQTRLIFKGKQLENERKLADYNIVDGDVLNAVLCLRKPVILFYNYPLDQEITCSVNLKRDFWKFSHSHPRPNSVVSDYDYTWRFYYKDNLRLIDKDTHKEFSYIFWESETVEKTSSFLNDEIEKNYFCFKRMEVLDQIDTILTSYGLNVTERNDLITFWIQNLTSSPFTKISFVKTEDYNDLAGLQIEPYPSQIIRICMLIKPCTEYCVPTMKLEDVEPIVRSQNEPLVVEWGGITLI